jgi:hypothetical protein
MPGYNLLPRLEITNQYAWRLLWEGCFVIFIHWEVCLPPHCDVVIGCCYCSSAFVLKNDLKLHYRVSKFKFWTRLNWPGKTWFWKLKEDTQGPRFGGIWERQHQSPWITNSESLRLEVWLSSRVLGSIPSTATGEKVPCSSVFCVLKQFLFLLCCTEQSQSTGWSRSLFSITFCVPVTVLWAEDSAVTK